MRIPQIDGLRGVAILSVMLYHFTYLPMAVGVRYADASGAVETWLKAYLLSGYVGVDLFFVLSGFLITDQLRQTRDEPSYFRNFFARRALRIFPAYVLLLATWFVSLRLWPMLAEGKGDSHFVWLATYTGNFLISARGWEALPTAVHHVWSLAIEEQFYLVWPLLIFFIPPRPMLRACLVLVVASPLLRYAAAYGGAIEAANTFTLARVDALAWGAALAIILRDYRNFPPRLMRYGLAVSGATLAAIFVTHAGLDPDSPIGASLGMSLRSFAFVCLLGLLVRAEADAWYVRLFSSSTLRWFGRYSYGLYLFHQPVVLALFVSGLWSALRPERDVFFLQLSYNVALPLAASGVLAWSSWHLCEKHFLKWKSRFTTTPSRASVDPGEKMVG